MAARDSTQRVSSAGEPDAPPHVGADALSSRSLAFRTCPVTDRNEHIPRYLQSPTTSTQQPSTILAARRHLLSVRLVFCFRVGETATDFFASPSRAAVPVRVGRGGGAARRSKSHLNNNNNNMLHRAGSHNVVCCCCCCCCRTFSGGAWRVAVGWEFKLFTPSAFRWGSG
jgi:hypothetical protein